MPLLRELLAAAALHPERFGPAELAWIKAELGPTVASASPEQ
jgi:hypothetical protein